MCGWLRRIGPVRLRCAQSRLRRFQSGGDRFVVSCSLNISNLIVCTSFADVQKKTTVCRTGVFTFLRYRVSQKKTTFLKFLGLDHSLIHDMCSSWILQELNFKSLLSPDLSKGVVKVLLLLSSLPRVGFGLTKPVYLVGLSNQLQSSCYDTAVLLETKSSRNHFFCKIS